MDKPGTQYQVTVHAFDGHGRVIAEGKAKASCKYVRYGDPALASRFETLEGERRTFGGGS